MMCFAFPLQVVEIKEGKVVVVHGKQRIEVAKPEGLELVPGDYVIVANKIIVKKLDASEAKKFFMMLEDA